MRPEAAMDHQERQERLQQPARTFKECRTCQGDGYSVSLSGAGTFSISQDCWVPVDEVYTCPDCNGTGDHPGPEISPNNRRWPGEESDAREPTKRLSGAFITLVAEPDLPF